MAIHDNLRNLRLASGMTQEQAADRAGLTRQGLSSYETGRTQPSIEMLDRLAGIYGVDLDSVLYGKSRAAQAYTAIRSAETVICAVFAALTLVSSALLWTADHFFSITSGTVTEASRRIFDVRTKLIGAHEFIDSILLAVSFAGLLALLVFCAAKNCRFSLRHRLIWAAISTGCMLLIAFLFGVTDHIFGTVDYMLTPLLVSSRLAVFLILDIVIQRLQRRRGRAK